MMPSAGYRILVVEDDDDWIEMIRLWLETGGYRDARFASTLREARNALSDFRPDCLILDLQLGEEDGSQLCREIRRDPATAKIPVVIMTNFEEEKIRSLTKGADYFLGKTPKASELLATLNAVFRRRDLDLDLQRKDDLAFQPERREVYLDGTLAAALTPKEYELFLLLVKSSPAPVRREELLKLIDVKEDPGISRGLEILIDRLRRALPKELRRRVKAIRGFGYTYIRSADAGEG